MTTLSIISLGFPGKTIQVWPLKLQRNPSEVELKAPQHLKHGQNAYFGCFRALQPTLRAPGAKTIDRDGLNLIFPPSTTTWGAIKAVNSIFWV